MPGGSLASTLKAVARVRTTLKRAVAGAGIDPPRVKQLVEVLGLDKSTASRVLRGIRADTPGEAMRELPAAEGLLLFLRACAVAGADADVIEQGRRAVQAVDGLIQRFPGGRSGLLTALAEAVPSKVERKPGARTRAKAERSARRAGFTSACYVQGLLVEAAVHGLILGPGSSPGIFDQVLLQSVVGIKRLRSGPPVTLGGFYGSPLTPGAPTRLTLAGEPIMDDARCVLLPQFCDGTFDRIHAERRDRAFLLWLDRDDPPLDKPATLTYAVRYPDFLSGHKSASFHYACTNFTVRRPTRLFVLELMVHQSAFNGRPPDLRFNSDPQRVPDPINGPPRDGRECLELTSAFVPMGRGFDTPSTSNTSGTTGPTGPTGTGASESHLDVMRHAMSTLGYNPLDYHRYRLEIEYPLMFVGMQVWFELDSAT
jgi:hypothetical protein